MKGYKAFRKGLICRDKVYKENTVFEEDNAEICRSGMHFCTNPINTLDYYHLIDNEGNVTEFAEVEALSSAKTDNNEKFCTKKLKIGSRLSLSQFIDASLNFTSQKKKSNTSALDDETLIGGPWTKLVGGNSSKLVGGDNAIIVGRYNAKLVGGNEAALVGDEGSTLVGDNWAELVGSDFTKLVGNNGAKLVGGDGAKLVGGNGAILVGGDGAILVGGGSAKLTGGDCAKVIGSNYATLAGGEDAIIVGDNGSAAKGKKGSIILLIERDNEMNIINFKAVQVDGEKIKEDTLYELKNGELVEAAKSRY